MDVVDELANVTDFPLDLFLEPDDGGLEARSEVLRERPDGRPVNDP
jgi:hypothetical protein